MDAKKTQGNAENLGLFNISKTRLKQLRWNMVLGQ